MIYLLIQLKNGSYHRDIAKNLRFCNINLAYLQSVGYYHVTVIMGST